MGLGWVLEWLAVRGASGGVEGGLAKKSLSLLSGLFFSGWNQAVLSPVFPEGADKGTKVDGGHCTRPKC